MTTKAIVTSDYLDGVTLLVSGSRLVVNDTSKIPLAQKGVANGVAALGSDGRVPPTQLPSYVQDVAAYVTTANTAATNASMYASEALAAQAATSSLAATAVSAAASATAASALAVGAESSVSANAAAAVSSAASALVSATSASGSATAASAFATDALNAKVAALAAQAATTTSAANALVSADSAAAQATTATTQAGIATTQAGLAGTSASQTAALLASFRHVLLGAFTDDAAAVAFAASVSIPIVDGILYENTVEDKFRIYNGTAWQDYDSSAQVSQAAAAMSATNAATSATSASGSATAASISATSAAGSATAASGSATTATTQASEASAASLLAQAWATQTSAEVVTGFGYGARKYAIDASISATSAAGSATAAASSALSATGAAASVAGSAAAALLSATSAATSATSASGSASAASVSSTSAAGSATVASTQASSAGISATSAAASQVAALTSATSSSTSQIAAAGSATSAAASAVSAATQAAASLLSATSSDTRAVAASISATSAAGSATAASASAGTASTESNNATSQALAAQTYASSASISSGTATTQAGNASAQASAAAGSATAASTSATSAAASQVAASTSATSAASSQVAASTSATSAAASQLASASSAANSLVSATSAAASQLASASSAANSLVSATSAASSQVAASTSATSAAASQLAAATSATSAASSQVAAATSATSAAASATAGATSATSAAASAVVAGNQASTATTQAGIAATQAGLAATSATSAAGSATAASGSATAASGSATAASGSATSAAASATAAASSASSAAAAAVVLGVATNRPSVRPSFLVDFASTRTLDPRITFGRSSPAMAYDGKTTVKAEENLFIYSQVIGNWTKSAITVTDNVAVAPDGTTTASKLVATAASGGHTAYQLRTDPTAGNSYTVTVFAKAAEYSKLFISDVGLGRAGWLFDLLNGTVLTQVVGVSASINSAGNGWYRCSLTFLNGAGNTYIGLAGVPDTGYTLSPNYAQYTGDATSGIYVWGAQLEQRAYATAYTPTTTAAITNYIPALQSYAANVARFDVKPVTGESLGLMVEEQRANLISYSQDFDVPTYSKTNLTVAANCIVAPDGTLTADKLIATAVTGTHATVQPISTVSGTTYALSVYAKAGEVTVLRLMAASLGALVNADLSAGTLSGGSGVGYVSSSITPVGDNWYRIVLVYTEASTGSNSQAVYLYSSGTSFTGTGYGGLYLWGMQLEAGAFATSYIPTLLTYSGRGSTATYIGDNGLIQTAAANTARYQRNIAGAVQLLLEGAATNLMLWSANFNSASDWLAARVFIMPNAIVAPDGTKTGAKVVATAGTTTDHAIYKSINSASANGVTHTLSVYAKAGEFNWLLLAETATYVGRYFNLATGEIGGTTSWVAPVSSSITPVGNGWYRCQISWVQSGTVLRPVLEVAKVNNNNSYTGDGVSGIYIWGAQLETGSVATSYIPSTETFTGRSGTATYFDPSGVMRTAPAGLARYDFDPVTKLSKGLLIEAAATNLITYADDQANAAWTASGCTVTSNAIAAPDGTTTADKLVEDSAASTSHGTYRAGMTMTAAAYTLSIFARAAERTFIKLVFTASGDGGAYFNLGTGAVATVDAGYTATIQDVGGGYYRCSITVTCTAATWYTSVYLASADNSYAYNGNGTSGAYVWGAQLELGSVATSYIPTTSAQVTRAADTATSVANSRAADVWSSGQATRTAEIPYMTVTPYLKSDEITLYAEGMIPHGANPASNFHLATISDTTSKNYIKVRFDGSNLKAWGQTYANGNPVINTGNNVIAANSFAKVVAAAQLNNHATTDSGSAVLTGTGAAPVGLSRLNIGWEYDGLSQALNGYIKRIAIYPKRLTNTELQGLTS